MQPRGHALHYFNKELSICQNKRQCILMHLQATGQANGQICATATHRASCESRSVSLLLWLVFKYDSCIFEQVFGKGAKFSLFKPAEEMVYIGLDEESRTKGKAAIDVVGAQTGKSTSSILQQVNFKSIVYFVLPLFCPYDLLILSLCKFCAHTA